MTILAIDVGNTRIHFAIFTQDTLQQQWHLNSTELHHVCHFKAAMQHLEKTEDIESIVIASVVPRHNAPLALACKQLFKKEVIFAHSQKLKRWIHIAYEPIEALGADRIVNAFAARCLFPAPLIVIDAGTAITFDLINPQESYQAGVIMPGVSMSFKALSQAAQLHHTPFDHCRKSIVTHTTQAMQSGCYWAAVGAIESMVQQLKTQASFKKAMVIGTGGNMPSFLSDLRINIKYVPQLTLKGLAIIAQKERESLPILH